MKKKLFLFVLLFFTGFIVKADLIGQAIPSCPAKSEDNQQKIDFKKYIGKVVLIDFWATWCPPCKQSMPFLDSLREELSPQGFEIIAINVDEDRGQVVRFLQAHPVNYKLAYDESGECPETFGVKAMPSSYFIDRQGRVRNIHLGYRKSDQEYIRSQINQLLVEK